MLAKKFEHKVGRTRLTTDGTKAHKDLATLTSNFQNNVRRAHPKAKLFFDRQLGQYDSFHQRDKILAKGVTNPFIPYAAHSVADLHQRRENTGSVVSHGIASSFSGIGEHGTYTPQQPVSNLTHISWEDRRQLSMAEYANALQWQKKFEQNFQQKARENNALLEHKAVIADKLREKGTDEEDIPEILDKVLAPYMPVKLEQNETPRTTNQGTPPIVQMRRTLVTPYMQAELRKNPLLGADQGQHRVFPDSPQITPINLDGSFENLSPDQPPEDLSLYSPTQLIELAYSQSATKPSSATPQKQLAEHAFNLIRIADELATSTARSDVLFQEEIMNLSEMIGVLNQYKAHFHRSSEIWAKLNRRVEMLESLVREGTSSRGTTRSRRRSASEEDEYEDEDEEQKHK